MSIYNSNILLMMILNCHSHFCLQYNIYKFKFDSISWKFWFHANDVKYYPLRKLFLTSLTIDSVLCSLVLKTPKVVVYVPSSLHIMFWVRDYKPRHLLTQGTQTRHLAKCYVLIIFVFLAKCYF